MDNKKAKALIERLTPTNEWGCQGLPWGDDENWLGNHINFNKDKRIMRKVKKLLSDSYYKDVISYIKDCEGGFNFDITFKYSGDEYSEDCYEFKKAYVDQYTNGGYSGDEFAGQVWLPITPKRYLTFHYAM